jgi:hypothetical protein
VLEERRADLAAAVGAEDAVHRQLDLLPDLHFAGQNIPRSLGGPDLHTSPEKKREPTTRGVL